ncbi:hypothetical protein EST38_g11421 [Candolleomyces aberdarensis]|uniref:Uncharacterized protein n=1 Tax=Candolleomyces aberdarensis TaxID=2316362 RepID=A0A4Q2D764_9AGAR|nr:hypothetical protein EST38_g11421 [Candolleomyces aberdarensis]
MTEDSTKASIQEASRRSSFKHYHSNLDRAREASRLQSQAYRDRKKKAIEVNNSPVLPRDADVSSSSQDRNLPPKRRKLHGTPIVNYGPSKDLSKPSQDAGVDKKTLTQIEEARKRRAQIEEERQKQAQIDKERAEQAAHDFDDIFVGLEEIWNNYLEEEQVQDLSLSR